jgi:hypothetical protein
MSQSGCSWRRVQDSGRQGGMGWKNLGEKPVVRTPWFRLNLPLGEVPALIAAGQIRAASTVAALLYLHAQ